MATVDAREDVAQAIQNAKADLDQALLELERIPAFDPTAIVFVAHAMTNYVNVTAAVLDLLKVALEDHPDPEVLEWLERLRHVSNLSHQTVARLLGVYHPAEIPLRFEYMNLAVLIERACAYYRASATSKQIEIVSQSTGHVPPVWADRVAVAIAADNLLSNAVKFSNPGGRIVVQILPGPGGAVCSVSDSGPGLTPLMQSQLFERGDIPGSPLAAGAHPTGYGLIVAKAFIDRMGGRLWSESEPGKGARFSFRLPYQPPSFHASR